MLFYFSPRGHCHRQTSVISISLPPFWCLSISIDNSTFSREYWNWQLNWQFSILQGKQGNATLKKESWSRDLARQVSNKGRKTRHWEISVILIHSTEVKIYHSTSQLKGLNPVKWVYQSPTFTCNLFIWRISCNDFTCEISHWLLFFLMSSNCTSLQSQLEEQKESG